MIARIKKRLYLVVVRYFKLWANLSLKRWNPRIIAVTGSVGKTTMLRMVELQLEARAAYTHNANSAYGIAFHILGMDGVTGSKLRWIYLFLAAPFRAFFRWHNEEFYVVEIDGERPKETEFLAKWLKPEVTIWVSLGRSHAAYYDQQVQSGLFPTVEEAIAHEFGFLPCHTQKMIITKPNVPLIDKQLTDISAEVAYIDTAKMTAYSVKPHQTIFTIEKTDVTFCHPMPREVTEQLLMLQLLANYLDMPLQTDMSAFEPAPGRNSALAGVRGTTLIDSSYNAHLISMESILGMFQMMVAEKKWVVIGDMTEQGQGEKQEHEKLGEVLAQVEAERYILVGRRVTSYTKPALEKTQDAKKIASFAHAKEALSFIEKNLSGGETILFKGSQYLEWIVEKLLENPSDVAKLPRQEPSAKRRRQKWGLN